MQALPFIALGLQLGGQIEGGIAGKQAADYHAAVARNNATIATNNARYSAAAGAARAEQEGLKERQVSGQLRASIGASGIDVNSGSAADVQQSQREIGLLDTATVANNAALQVYGYKSQATNFEAQSELDKMQGENDLIAGFTGAAGSAISSSPYLPDKFAWMSNGVGDEATADAGSEISLATAGL